MYVSYFNLSTQGYFWVNDNYLDKNNKTKALKLFWREGLVASTYYQNASEHSLSTETSHGAMTAINEINEL